MSDSKKYYYLKLKENFFETDTMIILENMPDGYLYANILLKLYLRSLKSDGKLMFNEKIPFNPAILAQVTRHNVGNVEKALNIFMELELIEVMDNGAIYMMDIQNFIGSSSTHADRVREYRSKIEKEKEGVQMLEQMCNICAPEKEIELETDIEKELELDIEKKSEKTTSNRFDYHSIISLFNSTCVSFPKVQKLSKARQKVIRSRFTSGYTEEDFKSLFEKAEESKFLKGKNNRNWQATFDWIIKDANMAKILDGNYSNELYTANTQKDNDERKYGTYL